jgi:dienelactone hydrolase
VLGVGSLVAIACGGSGGGSGGTTAGGTTPSTPAGPNNGVGVEVTVTADDGVRLAGTYYHVGDRAGRCYIFVHQLSSTRAEWQPIIDRLPEGSHILAFDMRGHGASTQGPDGSTIAWKSFETADWEKVESDIARVMDEMNARRTGTEGCVVAGSSIGSSAALRYAASHPGDATALLLLSPGLAYRGVTTPDAARASKVPVLIVHSQENGAADAAGALKGIWEDATPPVDVEVISDPGQAHGMKIVAGDPAILERVVAFLADPRGPRP